MRLYLDSCCFNRPFDDLRQERVRFEAEAITAILRRIESGEFRLIVSEVLDFELGRMPDVDRRSSCISMMKNASEWVPADVLTKVDADWLSILGFGPLDAAHLASARRAGVDVFLTVDDALLRRARSLGSDLVVRVESPLAWLLEHSKGEAS